jgi:hypothetical protein
MSKNTRKTFLTAGYAVQKSSFDAEFNGTILTQFMSAQHTEGLKKTHFFNDRYENIYLSAHQVPHLRALVTDANNRARCLLGRTSQKVGCWFNAMGPASNTSLHRHDEDDECLSGVYYIAVPENSGDLVLYPHGKQLVHTPRAGQWIFFPPQTEHEVTHNESPELRLSLAFNFS